MKQYSSEQIRNVALAGHSGSGKTALAEAMLFLLKFTDRLGRVESGSTVSDYDPEETERQCSINASVLPFDYKNHKINLLDLPGYRDFIGEQRNSLRAADAAIILLDATSGIEVGTEFAWDYVQEFELPTCFFINKLDKERASFDQTLNQLRSTFHIDLATVTIPVGEQANFAGVIDLINMKYLKSEAPGKVERLDIPEEHKAAAEQARFQLAELAAEGEDALTEKFLEEESLTAEEILRGLKNLLLNRKAALVFAGSAYNCNGVTPLLEAIATCFPPPVQTPGFIASFGEEKKRVAYDTSKPFSAFVFKTVSDPYAGRLNFFKVITGEVRNDATISNPNKDAEEKLTHLLIIRGKKQENVPQLVAGDIGAVAKLSATTYDTFCTPGNAAKYEPTPMPSFTISMAMKAKSKTDEDKIGMALHRLIEQDPTLEFHRDPEIRQTIVSGMGDTHLDVALSRLRSTAQVEVELIPPRIPYKETITSSAKGQGKYKKQSGGRGQYGDVWLQLEPLPQGSGFEFEWKVVGGVIPSKYQPSIEKGIKEAMGKGILAGYQVVDMKATAYDGTHHSVDSSDIAFKIAGSMAFRSVALQANPILLEPIVDLKVTVPEANMGDIMGDLSAKRGRILGNERIGNKIAIMAQVPAAELATYSRELRSMTQGRGIYEMSFSHYEAVPSHLQEKIIEDAKARAEEEH